MTTENDTVEAITATTTTPMSALGSEEETTKAVQRRYDGLITVRNKAIKGKGAWYWAHLQPFLLTDPDTTLPKAVRLRCSLCDASFSASNPSRTASEHLKRGACHGLVVTTPFDKPIFTTPACTNRKRYFSSSCQVLPLTVVDPTCCSSSDVAYTMPPPPLHSHNHSHHLVLSGGKEDLGALAMLEDSVKKLKTPKSSTGAALSKAQAESALSLFADWVYESSGAVAFSSVDHPKFRAFLQQVGLPPIPRRDLVGARLDARYEESKWEADARIRDALFFQVSSGGWKSTPPTTTALSSPPHPHPSPTNSSALADDDDDKMVVITVNLPNGISVFRKVVFISENEDSSDHAQKILWDTVMNVCSGMVQRCAGIIADKFKSKALRHLELQNHWMINLSCQIQAFHSLLKDFSRHLPLFRRVVDNCSKLANFLNSNSSLLIQQHPPHPPTFSNSLESSEEEDEWIFPKLTTIEDFIEQYEALNTLVLDESYKALFSSNDPIAGEVSNMIQDRSFWDELDAIQSLVKLVRSLTRDMELERPLVGQCLPLWMDLRSKLKEWCDKFNVEEVEIEKLVERRFYKNYHPAWSAAFILDPLYLVRDTTGKYLPPFKCLTTEQDKDVDRLIIRLVSPEEAHIVLMELMKWRSEGLDALYAQAVQIRQQDPMSGKMKIVNPQSSRLVWETYLRDFQLLRTVAVRLIFLQATAGGLNCDLSILRWDGGGRERRLGSNVIGGMDRLQKMVFIAANSKLERRDFLSEENDLQVHSSTIS
ncbi:hypothetical protein ZOSMA_25G01600 [Zostera marina]|uniref:DUF7963 domain-containing protein n=1 Tax=Zostera marina TaxID=29655 RepID=A0A0K9PFM9_ZOSMR|nr:hypothetical protein ZOSMA_25G01600 [Zostera marina]